jgi:hypothetical protein
MSYAELQTDIVEFSTRSDISTKVPTFIRLAEAWIYRRVRVLEMQATAELEFLSPDYAADLPENFLGFKRVRVVDAANPSAEYIGPDQFAGLGSASPADYRSLLNGATLLYTLEANQVFVSQPRGANAPIELATVYYRRFDPLSDSNSSNALLQAHPDLFLYASLAQLWDWADELEQSAKYFQKAEKCIGEVDALEVQRNRPAGKLVRTAPRGIAR